MKKILAIIAIPFMLVACSNSEPSLSATDSKADYEIKQNYQNGPYHSYTPMNKRRASLKNSHGNVFDVVYDIELKQQYNYGKHFLDISNTYKKKLTINGGVPAIEMLLAGKAPTLGQLATLATSGLSLSDVDEFLRMGAKAVDINEKYDNSEDFQKLTDRSLEKCGKSCEEIIVQIVGNSKQEQSDNKVEQLVSLMSMLLAVDDLKEYVEIPEQSVISKQIKFQISE